MHKKILTVTLASLMLTHAYANEQVDELGVADNLVKDVLLTENLDPFSGDELLLEKLNSEIQLKKAIVASIREQLQQTTVAEEIKLAVLKGEYDRKKVQKDIERLDDAPAALTSGMLTPASIAPPVMTPSTDAPDVAVAPVEAAPVKPIVKPKKAKPQPDTVLGAIKFGNEEVSYLVEKADGRYAATTELDPKAVHAKQTGFYTTIQQSDIFQGEQNQFGRQGSYAPFGQQHSPGAGSVPIHVPQLATPMQPPVMGGY